MEDNDFLVIGVAIFGFVLLMRQSTANAAATQASSASSSASLGSFLKNLLGSGSSSGKSSGGGSGGGSGSGNGGGGSSSGGGVSSAGNMDGTTLAGLLADEADGAAINANPFSNDPLNTTETPNTSPIPDSFDTIPIDPLIFSVTTPYDSGQGGEGGGSGEGQSFANGSDDYQDEE